MENSPKRRKLSASSPQTSDIKAAGDSSDAVKDDSKQEGESSPARCPICLAPPENRAKSESCSHFFCFSCLKEWSKVKAECPLCKMPIRTIYHSIKSDREFEEYHVKFQRPGGHAGDYSHRFMGVGMTYPYEQLWNLRIREYRAHLQRSRENELAARQASSNTGDIRTRRMYYWNKTRVRHVETGNRVRDVSAEFFRENPSQMHRLEPWLKRELSVLYGAHNKVLISNVRDKIMAAVPTIGITSQSFVNLIQPYMLEHTDQFIHELVSFAKSPYDIHQYDRHTRYTPAPESSSSSSGNMLRRPRRSRWDDSPDAGENPGEPTSQSVMLSQTSWGDDAASIYPIVPVTRVDAPSSISFRPTISGSEPVGPYVGGDFPTPPQESFLPPVGIPHPGFHYSSLYPSRSYNVPRSSRRYVEAPLIHQTIEAHRPGASSARQHGRMEIMRQHFDQHTRHRRAEARKRRAPPDPAPSMRTSFRLNPQDVIVISSDSSDKELGTSSGVGASGSKAVLHYKPTTTQNREEREKRTKIKKEKLEESSTDDISDSTTSSDDSDIEFVKYIKPPHLRTPEAFIDLSSTDDDAPGPSTRHTAPPSTATFRQLVTSSSSESDSSVGSSKRIHRNRRKLSSASSGRSKPDDILQRTKAFLRKAWEARKISETQSSGNDGEIDVVTMPEASTMLSGDNAESISGDKIPALSEVSENATSLPETATSLPSDIPSPGSSSLSTQPTPSHDVKQNPKKVFERGKVSVNFAKPKRNKYFDSDSDSDIDVGVEEVVPSDIYSRRPLIIDDSPQNQHEFPSSLDTNTIVLSPTFGDEVGTSDPARNEDRPPRSKSLSGDSHRHSSGSSKKKHKHKKKHKRSDKHKSRRHESREGSCHNNDLRDHGDLNESLRPRHRSYEDEEYSRHDNETHGNRHKRSKKRRKEKSSKHRQRSRSSSVEFITQIRKDSSPDIRHDANIVTEVTDR